MSLLKVNAIYGQTFQQPSTPTKEALSSGGTAIGSAMNGQGLEMQAKRDEVCYAAHGSHPPAGKHIILLTLPLDAITVDYSTTSSKDAKTFPSNVNSPFHFPVTSTKNKEGRLDDSTKISQANKALNYDTVCLTPEGCGNKSLEEMQEDPGDPYVHRRQSHKRQSCPPFTSPVLFIIVSTHEDSECYFHLVRLIIF